MLLCITINMNQNYSKIPCFVEKNSKSTIQICSFYSKYLELLLLFPKLCVLESPYLKKVSPFELSQVTSP